MPKIISDRIKKNFDIKIKIINNIKKIEVNILSIAFFLIIMLQNFFFYYDNFLLFFSNLLI